MGSVRSMRKQESHESIRGSVKSSTGNFDVSVVILTRNSERTVERSLRSAIGEKPGEILVVDGVSTDATHSIVKRYGIQMIIDPVRSLGHSRQLGVEAAKGAYVMFVDSDAVLTPGCISTLVRELERYGWAGIHALLLSAENVSYWQRAEDNKYMRAYDRVRSKSQIDTIVALFRKEALLACAFDPFFRESYEDVDLSFRLLKGGYRLGVSSAVAYHYHRREFSAFARQRFRGGLGRARFGVKYRKTTVFVDPILAAFSQMVRNAGIESVRFVPYWTVAAIAESLGVVVGLSRVRSEAKRELAAQVAANGR
jgi:cellulose synthase/poly-beta-1,6-N-acetylglucosamine synthase-like glycosyltransferase